MEGQLDIQATIAPTTEEALKIAPQGGDFKVVILREVEGIKGFIKKGTRQFPFQNFYKSVL